VTIAGSEVAAGEGVEIVKVTVRFPLASQAVGCEALTAMSGQELLLVSLQSK
jgi:hypothetical protein